jgi:hypothetical protein
MEVADLENELRKRHVDTGQFKKKMKRINKFMKDQKM